MPETTQYTLNGFDQLSDEIQIAIFELAVPEPRIMQIRVHPPDDDICDYARLTTSTKPSALLRLNKLSRGIILKKLNVCLEEEEGEKKIRFNGITDIVSFWQSTPGRDSCTTFPATHFLPEGISNIQNLLFEHRCGPNKLGIIHFAAERFTFKFLSAFNSLQTLHINSCEATKASFWENHEILACHPRVDTRDEDGVSLNSYETSEGYADQRMKWWKKRYEFYLKKYEKPLVKIPEFRWAELEIARIEDYTT